jgi:hypothetical protein
LTAERGTDDHEIRQLLHRHDRLGDPGYAGTPINDRWYSNEELAGVLHKAVAYAKGGRAGGR